MGVPGYVTTFVLDSYGVAFSLAGTGNVANYSGGRSQDGRALGHYEIDPVMLGRSGVERVDFRARSGARLGIADAASQRQFHGRHDEAFLLQAGDYVAEETVHPFSVRRKAVRLLGGIENQLGIGDGVASEEDAQRRHGIVRRRIGIEDIFVYLIVQLGELFKVFAYVVKLLRKLRVELLVSFVFRLYGLFLVGAVELAHNDICHYGQREHGEHEFDDSPDSPRNAAASFADITFAHSFLAFSVSRQARKPWDACPRSPLYA